jgi:hypothetical protein
MTSTVIVAGLLLLGPVLRHTSSAQPQFIPLGGPLQAPQW